jgi:hypothetical protein
VFTLIRLFLSSRTSGGLHHDYRLEAEVAETEFLRTTVNHHTRSTTVAVVPCLRPRLFVAVLGAISYTYAEATGDGTIGRVDLQVCPSRTAHLNPAPESCACRSPTNAIWALILH